MSHESEAALLHRISRIVSSALSLDEMLGEVIGLTIQTTACDACLVYLYDSVSNELVLRASQVPHTAAIGNVRLRMGEGVTGWVAENRSVVALPSNAAADARFKHVGSLIEDTYEAILSVPLMSGGELVGIINVHHRESHVHSQLEISTLQFVGEQLGVACLRILLKEENNRLIEETLQARKALEGRKVLERAKGILQRRLGLSEEAAYLKLRDESRSRHKPMTELAQAIILAEDLSKRID